MRRLSLTRASQFSWDKCAKKTILELEKAIKIWLFSNLVEESLVNFQLKISQIMKAIGFTFNDLDFVIHSLQFTGMDGIFTMVQDAIAMAFKHFYEAV